MLRVSNETAAWVLVAEMLSLPIAVGLNETLFETVQVILSEIRDWGRLAPLGESDLLVTASKVADCLVCGGSWRRVVHVKLAAVWKG